MWHYMACALKSPPRQIAAIRETRLHMAEVWPRSMKGHIPEWIAGRPPVNNVLALMDSKILRKPTDGLYNPQLQGAFCVAKSLLTIALYGLGSQPRAQETKPKGAWKGVNFHSSTDRS